MAMASIAMLVYQRVNGVGWKSSANGRFMALALQCLVYAVPLDTVWYMMNSLHFYNQWIGFVGKILTGNHIDFSIKIMGFSG